MRKVLILLSLTLTTFAKINIDSLLKKYGVTKNQVGIAIIDKNGSNQFAHNADSIFIPASTFKIISAYYILKNTDIEKRFETSISIDGEIQNNILKGNLIIHSQGNPFFLSSDLISLLYELKQRGIKTIEGQIRLTGDLPNISSIGSVGLDDQSYNQGLSSFNINFNRFRLFGLSNGDFLSLPYLQGLEVNKNNSPMGPGEIIKRNYKNTEKEEWYYQTAKRGKFEIPIRDTEIIYLSYIKEILSKFDIIVLNKKLNKERSSHINISRTSSPSIKRLIELSLEYSNNLFIETLMLYVTKEKNLQDAAIQIQNFLLSEKLITKNDINKNIKIDRASGLSTSMFITPSLFTRIISKIYNQKIGDKFFFSYLSLAGSTGFIAKNFLDQKTFENFYAKTGSLDYINNICGVWIKGQEKFFCIMINDKDLRQKLDGVNSSENEELRQTAKKWKNAKDQLLEELIKVLF
ncbi:D-alanyl-D-alanine carboxypeptidase [Bacteriovorax sp. Seq25_V]|uniref:D-alanyl-D-alanine carboxypeptidase n=1 Tax=Bacteriovorax sp. Seq25_V TaxID=1201288 RepID=UPI00038A29DE|nr:D-alanyl-D-alanine carboxypeptidase [Bacteriovorax sp. Seq25_V]EQC46526.1 D-Ala-D-Ala carboxypeptidase 3 (S13) domain protein [Bacteriovorax sp. Seq25_V]